MINYISYKVKFAWKDHLKGKENAAEKHEMFKWIKYTLFIIENKWIRVLLFNEL